MPQGRMMVAIEGSAAVLRSARAIPGIDILGPSRLEDGRYALFAVLGPEELRQIEAEGARVVVVQDAEQHDAYLAECFARSELAQPVALVALLGPPEILGNLPVNFGIDPPLYSARPLDGGAWEISTQAAEEHIAAFRKAGLQVRILQSGEALARLRGAGR